MAELARTSQSPEGTSRLSLEEFVQKSPKLEAAYELAGNAHEGKTRAEGTPYVSHCVEVDRILYEEWGIIDEDILCAGLLHDTVEDTDVTLEEIRTKFGEKVAFLVDGVSKLRSEKSPDNKALGDRETVRKVFNQTQIDPVVGVLKLADRLHNMRTLNFVPSDKQVRKAIETEGYAKLAESLGMWKVMKELEDLALKYTSPSDFEKFSNLINQDPRTNKLFIGYMTSKLASVLPGAGIKAGIDTQINGIARLRHKMLREHRFLKINDVVSFKIDIDDSWGADFARNDCYKVLGVVRENFGEMEDILRFDDFYFQRQDNGFSAIQVTLEFPFASGKGAIEIAIGTRARAEFNNDGVVSLIRKGETDVADYALKLVFTPTGEVKFFKPGATGLDFAYSIEKYMGAQATGILINGVEMPISTVIPNASTVEILVGAPRVVPEREAINFVLKPARRMIEDQFADLEDQETIAKGKQMVTGILAERGLFDLYDLIRFKKHAPTLTRMLRSLGCKRYVSNLYRMVGLGQLGTDELKKELDKRGITKNELGLSSILIEGDDVKDLLGFMGKTVGRYGGNIKPMVNEPDEKDGRNIFRATLIVEDLPEKNIPKLKNALLKNSAIKRVEIV